MAKPPIVPLAQLKLALGVTGTTEDETLTMLEELAADWVEEQLGEARFREPEAKTEYVPGRGTVRLVLKGHVEGDDPPVTVTEQFAPGGTREPFTAFERRGDVLIRNDGLPWHDGAEYAVTYSDGYEDAPGDVKSLVIDLVSGARTLALGSAGIESETIGDYSYQVAADAIGSAGSFGEVSQKTLDRRRRMLI